MSVGVGVAQPHDFAALHRLIHEHAIYEGTTATVTPQRVAEILTSRCAPAKIIVARGECEIIGYASATLDFSTWHGERWLHLDCLFVRVQDRSRGVGKQLLAAVKALAAETGAMWIEWQTPAWNEEAIRFYVREGAITLPKVRLQLSPAAADAL